MKTFWDLVLKHKGKRICVMGGADSLESDLLEIDSDIYISTNGHGVGLVKPDYLFAMDETNSNTQRPMVDHLKSMSAAPIISPRAYADYQLVTWPQAPRDVLSGMVATWCAFMMGAKVVILVGMDGYKDLGYIHESTKMARDVHCPVRVMSDQLARVWPKYDPDEKFGRYKPSTAINGWLEIDESINLEVVKKSNHLGRDLLPGEKFTAMRHQVRLLLKHKMVREV